tara:strand:- start:268 stop:693 length:426 start_codon:yes stop_codon:yes gene_type:complete
MEAWPETQGEAIHTSTFLGHPLSCVAGLAFLDVLKSEDLVTKSLEKGKYLMNCIQETLEPSQHNYQIRGRGLLVGIEFHTETGDPLKGMGGHVSRLALRDGLLVLPAGRYGEVVELVPPATITEEQIDFAVNGFSKILLGG